MLDKNSLLQLQIANLEVETLASKYLKNLDFANLPPNIQSLVNEILKKINLKNLKLKQEDYKQYIIFRNAENQPVFLIGNFSPESLALFVSN